MLSLTLKASFVNKIFPRNPFNPQVKFTPQSKPFSPQSKPKSPQSGPQSNLSHPSDDSIHSFTPKPRFSGEKKIKVSTGAKIRNRYNQVPHLTQSQSPLFQPISNYCKQSGHIISECIAFKKK